LLAISGVYQLASFTLGERISGNLGFSEGICRGSGLRRFQQEVVEDVNAHGLRKVAIHGERVWSSLPSGANKVAGDRFRIARRGGGGNSHPLVGDHTR
jgi:hypothetical protein